MGWDEITGTLYAAASLYLTWAGSCYWCSATSGR